MGTRQFRAADPGALLEVEMWVTDGTDAGCMPVICKDFIAFEILQTVSVVGCPHFIRLIRFELKN